MKKEFIYSGNWLKKLLGGEVTEKAEKSSKAIEEAAEEIVKAREKVAKLISASPDEIIFTSVRCRIYC